MSVIFSTLIQDLYFKHVKKMNAAKILDLRGLMSEGTHGHHEPPPFRHEPPRFTIISSSYSTVFWL